LALKNRISGLIQYSRRSQITKGRKQLSHVRRSQTVFDVTRATDLSE